MSAETEFKQSIANAFNPQWNVKIAPNNVTGVISGHDVFLYIVDTKTGWVGVGATTEKSFKSVRAQVLEKGKENFLGLGAHCSTEASQAMAPAESPLTLRAIEWVGYYLASLRTFDAVMSQKGDLKGHWICVVYELADKSRLSRPVYLANEQQDGFLDVNYLNQMVRSAVANDCSNPNSAAGSQIKAGGGAMLHPGLRPGSAEEADTHDAPRG